MGYKPKFIKSSSGFGDQGKATVQVNRSKKKIRVAFDQGNTYIVNQADAPDYLFPGEWMVSMGKDNKEIYSVRPVKGEFRGHISKFVAGENEKPVIKTKTASFKDDSGKPHDFNYEYFSVIIKIDHPEKYAGIELPFRLRSAAGSTLFAEGEIENFKSKGDLPSLTLKGGWDEKKNCFKSKYVQMLADFLVVSGAWERGPIPYQDNPLPFIEGRILRAKKELQFYVKDGWIVDIGATSTPDEEPEATDDVPWDEQDADDHDDTSGTEDDHGK